MKFFVHIICLFLAIICLSSCKKDHGVLGVDVQPAGDAVNTSFSDTTTIYTHTIKYDSTVSANGEYKFLGSNLDPYFGRIDAGICLNANMNLTNLDFGSDANIKSAEIILAVSNTYYSGDPNAQLTYSVYGLDSLLDINRIYYTNNTRFYDKNELLATYTTGFTTYNGVPVIRIPISNDYARSILLNPSRLTDNQTFQSAYKGFFITSSGSSLNAASRGIIYQCDLENGVSGFYLYYQNGSPSATRQDKSFQFTFAGTDAKRFMTVNYKPTDGGTPNLVQQIVAKDSTQGKQDLYLGGLGITKVKVYIPSLKNYAGSSQIAISRAELVFHVDPAFPLTNASYTVLPPPMLSLLPLDSLGRETYALDQVDAARYNGNYDSGNNQYVFDIARQAELISQGKVKNYGFYLVIANTQVLYATAYDGPSKELVSVSRDDYVERIVLAGSSNISLKPKLNLTYVKLKNKQ